VKSLVSADTIPENVDNMYMFNILQSLKPDADPEILKKQSLSSFLKRYAEAPLSSFLNQDPSSNNTPRIIMFDQLEELFGFYPENWHQQRQEFFGQVAEALNEDNMLRIVFIIREEYLAHISTFAHLLPGRLRARFRIERLRKDAAFEAVKGPLEKAKTAVNIKLIDKLFDEGIIDKLIEDLLKIRVETFGGKFREAKGEFVEPIQLQVVCQRLWIKLKKSQTDQINQGDFEYLEDVDKALEAFYVDAIVEVLKQTGIEEYTIRKWFEENLITSSGTRGMVHRGFKSTGGINNTAVDILEKKHLIRKEDHSGAQWYELTHDRFIKPILDSNDKRRKEREKARSKLWQNALANLQSDQAPQYLYQSDQDLRDKKAVIGAAQLNWWKELRTLQFLENIRRQDCIPFIGPKACTPWIPEANLIAERWAQKYDYPLRLNLVERTDDWWTWLPDQLSQVAEFLAIQEEDKHFPKILLCKELAVIKPPDFRLAEFRNSPPAVLADLNLPIYITTNYDHFIEEALKSRGKEPVTDFCRWSEDLVEYANENEINPQIYKEGSGYKPKPKNPLVYHLYGDIDHPSSMVLTKKDYDDFVIFLNKEEYSRHVLPLAIRREIISKNLLFVGYTLNVFGFSLDFSAIFQTVVRSSESRVKKGILQIMMIPGPYFKNDKEDRVKKYLEQYTNLFTNLDVYWGDPYMFSEELRNAMGMS
jgi:hypothetical protein